MKKNAIMLALMLVFACTTAFADDGETGHGNRNPEPTPTPAARMSNPDTNSSETTSSSDMFVIVLDAFRALTGR